MATAEEIEALLNGAGLEVASNQRLPNNTGSQLRLVNGAIVNVFDTGRVQVQGVNREPVQDAIGEIEQPRRRGRAVRAVAEARASVPSAMPAEPSKVFVVYGHDEPAKTQLEAMLRRWGLEPLILDQLPSSGQTIIEKLESYRAEASFAVVLATPDDIGYARDKPDEKAFRTRQNVVLELGMVLALIGRERVAILIKDAAQMERPSDIQGLVYIPFTDQVSDVALPLAKEMNRQGLNVSIDRL